VATFEPTTKIVMLDGPWHWVRQDQDLVRNGLVSGWSRVEVLCAVCIVGARQSLVSADRVQLVERAQRGHGGEAFKRTPILFVVLRHIVRPLTMLAALRGQL